MSDRKHTQQHAALPYRVTENGIFILLVTSRETRRWIIPKGWGKKGVEPQDMAALEAFEEAGVRGKVKKKPLGSFTYDKRLDDGQIITCEVTVFALEVTDELTIWPESTQRERRWVSIADAESMISEPGLVPLLRRLSVKEGT